MLLSWRLWRAIFHNSLYEFPVLVRSPDGKREPADLSSYKSRLAIGGWLLVMAFILLLYPSVLPTLCIFLFMTLVLFGGTLSGWTAATRIAKTIFREQEKARYDLLLLTPPGVLGVHWAIVTRNLRDDRLLRWLRWLPSGFFIFVGFLLFGLLIGIITTSFLWLLNDSVLGFSALFQVSAGLLVLGILYADYLQSVVMGVLIGILLPTYAKTQAENSAYALASACFFSVQALYYLIFGFVGLWLTVQVIVPALVQGRQFIAVIVLAISLAVMFASREIVVRWLWRQAEQRLQFDALDSGVRT